MRPLFYSMTTDLELTFDDVQLSDIHDTLPSGAIFYWIRSREERKAASNSHDRGRENDDADLPPWPAQPSRRRPTFDALIADILDTPLRDHRVSFDVQDPRSHSARAIETRTAPSSVWQTAREQRCYEELRDNQVQSDQVDTPEDLLDFNGESDTYLVIATWNPPAVSKREQPKQLPIEANIGSPSRHTPGLPRNNSIRYFSG